MSYKIFLTEQAVENLEKMDSSEEDQVKKRIRKLEVKPNILENLSKALNLYGF